ncbi:MAG: hypothetical protein JXA24_08015 [Proteobacteria bacterium]|nr:hypothetical protein [Pseudomonadota bacterium]
MGIEKIHAKLAEMPPAWISRAVSRGGTIANATEIKKLLGEPIPEIVDPETLPPEVAAFFAPKGLLERLRKKLSLFSRKKGGKIIPARNTIASVDEDDNLYVGVDFLAQHGGDEELIAGIVAHEWGHMMSDLPKGVDWSHLSWDRLHAIRREEEGDADAFSGRVMFLMGYSVEPMIGFLEKIDRRKKEKRLPCHKYHNFATRAAILREAFEAEKRAMKTAKRIFASRDGTGPKVGRIIGAG